MDTSIGDVARLAGVSTRTLRHYQDIGLLQPSRVGHGGIRYYDQAGITRLQRILLLRQLGLGLDAIADALERGPGDTEALEVHLRLLEQEQQRVARQIAAVRRTIAATAEGAQLMAQDMLDGFDHTAYRDEVVQRWGEDAYQRGERWWRGLGEAGRQRFRAETQQLIDDWRDAAAAQLPLDSEQVRALVDRHVAWLGASSGREPEPAYVVGLAEMYVADERFAATYGGATSAAYVRDALRHYHG